VLDHGGRREIWYGAVVVWRSFRLAFVHEGWELLPGSALLVSRGYFHHCEKVSGCPEL